MRKSDYSLMSRDELIVALEAMKLRAQIFAPYIQGDVSNSADKTCVLLEAVIENSPCDVLVATKNTGRIIFANSEACRINGMNKEKHLEFTLNSLQNMTRTMHYPDGSPMLLPQTPLAKSIFHGEEVRTQEVLLKRVDGPNAGFFATVIPCMINRATSMTGL